MEPSQSHPAGGERNLKLVIAYKGSGYHGWQRQADGLATVQGAIEAVAGRILGHPATVSGASRTDAGVHAAGQVANLRTPNRSIPATNFRRAVNSRLPADIVIVSACDAPADFQASRSATGKTYRYRIYTRPTRPVMHANEVWHYWRGLDAERMADSGRRLLGAHDFRGFAYSAEDRENTVRTIHRCEVSQAEDELHVFVAGDGFLYKMVRNIVGTLVEIGRGRWGPDRIGKILATRDRQYAGPTAPASGLCLMAVHYDGVQKN